MERALDSRCGENDGGGALGSPCDGKDGSRGWKGLWIPAAARMTGVGPWVPLATGKTGVGDGKGSGLPLRREWRLTMKRLCLLALLLRCGGFGSLAAILTALLLFRRPDVAEHEIKGQVVANLQEG